MPDVVVTVPTREWDRWLAEGALVGEPCPAATEYFFRIGGRPRVQPGERVYVVAHGKLRGYAPLVRLLPSGSVSFLVRRGDAVAVTIPETITGFRGFRYRWWQREAERSFPEWCTP